MSRFKTNRWSRDLTLTALGAAALIGFLAPSVLSGARVRSTRIRPAVTVAHAASSSRPSGVERLLSELRTDCPWAPMAARELARRGVEEAVPHLISLARESARRPTETRLTRLACLESLGAFDTATSRAYLQGLVASTTSATDLLHAGRALARIGDHRSIPALAQALASAQDCALAQDVLQDAIQACELRQALPTA